MVKSNANEWSGRMQAGGQVRAITQQRHVTFNTSLLRKTNTMRIACIALLGSTLLSGCATSPTPSSQAKPVPPERLFAFQAQAEAAHGTLVVTRDTGLTGSACNTILYIDGSKSAEIAPGETARFYLEPGERIIGVNSTQFCGGGLKERSLVLDAGAVKKYRISIDTSFSMDLAPTAF
ncbi:hypothetical protein [Pseudomonas sp. OV226]|uniref:hypothetical protein n=1 Tax=Pseudomonas sp. OV226 TaxID=2135588 RepID=UPI002114F684|nr:hypothetical protein [Pseudomonas sp. OV226]